MSEGPVLRAERLGKSYRTGRGELELFRGLDLEVGRGEMVAIVGESGAGKSSLLHLLAALDRPTSGAVWFGETQVDALSAAGAARFRNRDVGYVWQFHYLLPEFSAVENVAMPLRARGMGTDEARRRAKALLAEVELEDRAEHRSGELSGGEQQRVSIARALVTEPTLLLADEPTGDLDGRTAAVIFELLRGLQRAREMAGVLVTHNLEFARRCDRVLELREGGLRPT